MGNKVTALDEALCALESCFEDLQFWSGYASEYFKEKHNIRKGIERHKVAIKRLKGMIDE